MLEVIIREKCGTGPELLNVSRREWMRSYIAILWGLNTGGDVVRDMGEYRPGNMPASSRGTPGTIRKSPVKKQNAIV
jgi:hypothetical protein